MMRVLMQIIFGTAVVVCTACVLILFGPVAWVSYLGLEQLGSTHRPVLGLVLLISTITAGVAAMFLVFGAIIRTWVKRRRRRAYHLSLLQMTSDTQRRYLRAFMVSQSPILYPRLDSVAKSLRKAGILIVENKQGSLCVAAYQLKPWARELLKRHRDLLEVGSPVDSSADVSEAKGFGPRVEKFNNPVVA